MAKSAWADPLPDSREPHVEGLFFGADPCWSPAREFGKVTIEIASDLATREVYVVEACPSCRSGFDDTKIHPAYPCASCLEMVANDRLRGMLERSGVPESDDRARLALAQLRADIETCSWLRSIEVATDEESKQNIILVKTNRHLAGIERDGLPDEIEGVQITIQEPHRGRKAS